ncbi:flagellar motor switch protein FliN [Armatimonas sp.]|uniref:flagellar motor switch protein FliN n=1 Tax=Armatimonas sp. TaxID=1872638 RepID=UPI00286B34A0|nr:flagellar motor switch protein FliN [Armatimonas sp.]
MSTTATQESRATLEAAESIAAIAAAAEPAAESEVTHRMGATPFGHTPEYLLDVRLTVSAEIGRVQMPVRQVMLLAPGALVELQRSASEPVDILANGHCIARGEIVVIGEHFGVRITELGTPLPTQR